MNDAIWALAGLGMTWSGLRVGFHRAIVQGLHAPRLRHEPPLSARPLPGGTLEPLRLPGPRGRGLAAWMVWPCRDAAPHQLPAVLAMHGWGANASTMWPVAAPLVNAGMAVLLLDARCHGDSDDEAFTSLPRFAEDIAAGLRWLGAQPRVDAGRIALLGHSVGAAAALLHASRTARQEGQPVAAVVSLAAFAHPEELMRRILRERGVPYPVLGWAVLRHVQKAIGERFDAIAPVNTIRAVDVPVLLVHGRADETVPFEDAPRLQRAARAARLLAVDGGHDLREALAPHAAAIAEFLRQALQGPAGEQGQADEPGVL